ncbi:hypothetical protein OG613_48490 (plasmid) [Streptomyces sp. NBC_00015]|uniref:hypothetical protein n=1 Tax=Streptomyces sp. NBC_00015 TaxID=2903611 RepID=UPI002F9143FA
MRTMSWPPTTRDGAALAHAYVNVLSWPLFVDGSLVTPEQVEELMERGSGAVVQTRGESFDTVSVPRALGSDVLVNVDRSSVRVPSLVGDDVVTFLVEVGTGGCLSDISEVRIETGALVALPPTPGLRWDTSPWDIYADGPTALELPHARALQKSLGTALRTHRGHS